MSRCVASSIWGQDPFPTPCSPTISILNEADGASFSLALPGTIVSQRVNLTAGFLPPC